ncbi:Nif3-like dinuclear metal center hexameric protein [Campylobacter sp. MIT 99-7217]|uniref:Nif3-like dinuclear metal center hexameric protein n=1 Tax=Campylobacter sp. MIT 99-7217 TaxID=535091 RepID=UPI0011598D70|nr:Nif3-like dinuclear metal center hexameric protein [Campylobacter sp. MIT 99-7217]TQR33067.1 Nif3-like dinuclear metal center hexameric protein [Campylobacter sp. MIT 99-7217]
MKIAEIYEFLDRLSPFETQETWDNSGLLLGSLEDEVERIYLSLDIDEKLIEKAEENSLFITHHPLIFKGLKDLANEHYPRKFIKDMLAKNLSLISMHTNYDLSHLNAYFVKEILGFENFIQDKFLIYVDLDLSFTELCKHVKFALQVPYLKTSFSGKEKINRIAICTGSGGDLLPLVKADCFLSGDFKYHQAFEAISNDLSLIDLGHFESERCFANSLAKYLQNFPIKVIISVSKNPFQYF